MGRGAPGEREAGGGGDLNDGEVKVEVEVEVGMRVERGLSRPVRALLCPPRHPLSLSLSLTHLARRARQVRRESGRRRQQRWIPGRVEQESRPRRRGQGRGRPPGEAAGGGGGHCACVRACVTQAPARARPRPAGRRNKEEWRDRARPSILYSSSLPAPTVAHTPHIPASMWPARLHLTAVALSRLAGGAAVAGRRLVAPAHRSAVFSARAAALHAGRTGPAALLTPRHPTSLLPATAAAASRLGGVAGMASSA